MTDKRKDIMKTLKCITDVDGSRLTNCPDCIYKIDIDHGLWKCDLLAFVQDVEKYLSVGPYEDLISRKAVIENLYDWRDHSITDAEEWHLRQVIGDIRSMGCKEYER